MSATKQQTSSDNEQASQIMEEIDEPTELVRR
jgi:hypothetical protein